MPEFFLSRLDSWFLAFRILVIWLHSGGSENVLFQLRKRYRMHGCLHVVSGDGVPFVCIVVLESYNMI